MPSLSCGDGGSNLGVSQPLTALLTLGATNLSIIVAEAVSYRQCLKIQQAATDRRDQMSLRAVADRRNSLHLWAVAVGIRCFGTRQCGTAASRRGCPLQELILLEKTLIAISSRPSLPSH